MTNPYRTAIIVESILCGVYCILAILAMIRLTISIAHLCIRNKKRKRTDSSDFYEKRFFFLIIFLIAIGRMSCAIMQIVYLSSNETEWDSAVTALSKFLEIAPGVLFINTFFLLLLSWSRKYHKIRYYFHSRILQNACEEYQTEKAHGQYDSIVTDYAPSPQDAMDGILDTTTMDATSPTTPTSDIATDQSFKPNSINNYGAGENNYLIYQKSKKKEQAIGLSRGDQRALAIVRGYFFVCQVLIFALEILAIANSILSSFESFEEQKKTYAILMDVTFVFMILMTGGTWLLFSVYSVLLLSLIRKLTSDSVVTFFRQLNNKDMVIVDEEDHLKRHERNVVTKTTLRVALISIMCTVVLLFKVLLFIYQLCYWLTNGKAQWTKWLYTSRYSEQIALGYYMLLEVVPLTILLLMAFKSTNASRSR
jgi:hypothetical protein